MKKNIKRTIITGALALTLIGATTLSSTTEFYASNFNHNYWFNTQNNTTITYKEAKKIALAEVDNGNITYIKLHTDGTNPYYKILVKAYPNITEILVDGNTGEVTSNVTTNINDYYNNTENSTSSEVITQAEAEKIALENVGGTVLYTEYDKNNSYYNNYPSKYEVTVLTNNSVAEVKINATTGKIIEIDHDYDDYYEYTNGYDFDDLFDLDDLDDIYDYNNNSVISSQISKEEAEAIALERVGGKVIYTESDWDDGEAEYTVNINLNGMEVEVEVNGFGTITDVEYDD